MDREDTANCIVFYDLLEYARGIKKVLLLAFNVSIMYSIMVCTNIMILSSNIIKKRLAS